MLICFYFVLFFIAKCLSFCYGECCGDCCECWDDFWEDCLKKSNKEEEKEEKNNDWLKYYKEQQEEKNRENIKKIREQEEKIREQKGELENKIKKYLSYIKNQVENISNNVTKDDNCNKGILDRVHRINELINNFQEDEYFNTNSITQIQDDLRELQDLCSKADIIIFDVFYEKNEEWEKFLKDNGIQEEYKEEQNITLEIFSLENTLGKLRGNFGTYLLEIFKTRLFPTNKNGDKYKNEFMVFYKEYNIAAWINSLTEESFNSFYEKICKMTSNGLEKDINEECRKLLLTDKYLGFALLSDGHETQIFNAFCSNINSLTNQKDALISLFIDNFKRTIVEVIKTSIDQNLKIENDLKKNNSEKIKEKARVEYNKAIKGLDGDEIELTFYNIEGKYEPHTFFKGCKLSVLFDFVLSKGRELYYSDENGDILDEKLGYISYENEKGRLELKTAQGIGADSLNKEINNNENITIGAFYEKLSPNVYMFFQ